MAKYHNTPGLYRARLLEDSERNTAAISLCQNYAWNRELKGMDPAQPMGGLQVQFRAEAWPIDEAGNVMAEERNWGIIAQDRRGWMLVGYAKNGSKPLANRCRHLAEVFGLKPHELLKINEMTKEQLMAAEFDILLVPQKDANGQPSKYTEIAAIGLPGTIGNGNSNGGTFAVMPRATVGNADQMAQILRGLESTEAPAKANAAKPAGPTLPAPKPAAPKTAPVQSSLPVRKAPEAPAAPQWDTNSLWAAWSALHPEDVDGKAFYAEINKANGGAAPADYTKLEPKTITLFVNAHSLRMPGSNDLATDAEDIF